jgi:hypothetical protein
MVAGTTVGAITVGTIATGRARARKIDGKSRNPRT